MRQKVNYKRLRDNFFQFVKIDSVSGEEFQFAQFLLAKATEMGIQARLDEYWNLYLELPAAGEKLLLNTHMDTVEPGRGIIPQEVSMKGAIYIKSQGDTILGADSKAPIAAIFEALAIIKMEKLPHRNLQIVFTCQEEAGDPSARFINSDSRYCVVPDRGTPVGEYITQAPAAQVFELEIRGRKAYGPTSFNEGIHAIAAACELISKMQLGNISAETVVNLGKIQGGEMASMVPDLCKMAGSCYSYSDVQLQQFLSGLGKLLKNLDKTWGTSSSLILKEYFPGFSLPESTEIIELVTNSIQSAELPPVHKKYMAVSNANIINGLGIPTVLMGYGAEFQHTVVERISKNSLVTLTEVLLNLMTITKGY